MTTNDKTATHPRRWLNPGAALNRFKTPRGAAVGIASTERRRERYGFRIGGMHFLIARDTTSEVLGQAVVYPLPNTPPWLMGLINLRGNLIPVFDPRPVLGLAESAENTAAQKRGLLILDRGEKAAGLFIDGLPQTTAATQTLSRLPPLPNILRSNVTKAYVRDDVVWLEFDHQNFFQSLGGHSGSLDR